MLLVFALAIPGSTWICAAQENQQPPSPTSPPAVTLKRTKSAKQKTSAAKGKAFDINSASKEELAALPGSNPDLAQKIVDGRPYRQKTDILSKQIVPKSNYDQFQGQIVAKQPKR
jgi:competence protein ComEA